MGKLLTLAKEIIFPSRTTCFICGREEIVGEDDLCDACRESIHLCICPPAPLPLDGVSAGLLYTKELHEPMHRFKYRDKVEYAAFFCQYMSIPQDWSIDILCPVPLYYLREMKRTYNQSELLARRISAIYQIPYCRDLLEKTRNTDTQTRLNPAQRQRNVQNAFRAAPECKNLSVLLIDDVYTTGATLASCAKELKKQGASKVYALCACKTDN